MLLKFNEVMLNSISSPSGLMSAPRFINWNINYMCNFNCNHCYSRIPLKITDKPLGHYLHIIEEFTKANVFTVALGGGEPLMLNHYSEIISALSSKGVNTYVTTNAWFLDQEVVTVLNKAQLGTLYVSLDSPTPKIHDDFRNRQGSFERVVKGVRLAVKAGLTVKFSTVVCSINHSDLDDIVSIGKSLNIKGVEFKRFRPSGNGLINKDKYILNDEQNSDVKEKVRQLQLQYPEIDIQLVYGVEEEETGCPCGIKSLCVRPNGDVSPCVYNEKVIGNLFENSLVDIWINSPILAKMRAGKGCKALQDNRLPLMPLPIP